MRNGEGIENGKKKTNKQTRKRKRRKKKGTATTTIGLISKKTTFYILQTNVLKKLTNFSYDI